jgi:hypothetical protein
MPQIMLIPGQPSQHLLVTNEQTGQTHGVLMARSTPYPVVPDGSPLPGLSESFAAGLVNKGLCFYVSENDFSREEPETIAKVTSAQSEPVSVPVVIEPSQKGKTDDSSMTL